MPVDEVLMDAEEKMEKSLHRVEEEFSQVRTGKASPALVDGIRIDCYGTTMTMKEVAGITTPEPRLILIQPWDDSNVDPIRKAIEESNLGISPQVDGKIIRIPIPELSEERRVELTKVVKKISEEGRIAIRQNRREAMDQLKKEGKDGDLTEDDVSLGEKEVQKLTDQYIKRIDDLLDRKESDLMKV